MIKDKKLPENVLNILKQNLKDFLEYRDSILKIIK